MSASLVETCLKLAAYLVCVGVALELSHSLYWRINKQIISGNAPAFWRVVLSTFVALIPLATALSVTAVFSLVVDSRSLLTLGLNYDGDSLTSVAYGAAVALGCVTVVCLVGVLLGYIQIRPSKMSENSVACLPLFLGGLIDFFSASVFEEVIFRGYVFFVLYRALGSDAAIFGSALLFALAHAIKQPNTPGIYYVNALVFGILVAACRNHTGNLWLPIGLHFGWNVVSGPIFGLPFGGNSYERGVVVSEVSGPAWLTGGLYSLDAGLLGTIALMIAAAGLVVVTPLR